ncbi:hypothetical protein EKO27_g4665 [Xylaria grammica]|uniref:Uncharacterized protein n=1 Tax=Xylaria grammica TaxID=363999 RepID=A0A439D7Q8_9PEZI|nr:hypothetical protein EKO27_g4665 [Xylaria grammica]
MDSARKIELQVAEDLAYLVANVRRAATARIDEAFPPVDDSSEDELRTRIEELVNESRRPESKHQRPPRRRLAVPVPRGSSNPLASSEPEEVFEPFDARKRARVEALTTEEEDLLRDIAHLKKSVPGTVAGAWAEAARKGVKDDEEALERVNLAAAQFGKLTTSDPSAAAAAGDGSVLAITPLEHQDDVETSFGDAVRGLGRLKKEMPAVVARMERARKAGEYVITER